VPELLKKLLEFGSGVFDEGWLGLVVGSGGVKDWFGLVVGSGGLDEGWLGLVVGSGGVKDWFGLVVL
jgi:hypothetical protein